VKNEKEYDDPLKFFSSHSHSSLFPSAAGRSDSGCSGCLATLRRGSGGAPSYRSHSVAKQPQRHYKRSTAKGRLKILLIPAPQKKI